MSVDSCSPITKNATHASREDLHTRPLSPNLVIMETSNESQEQCGNLDSPDFFLQQLITPMKDKTDKTKTPDSIYEDMPCVAANARDFELAITEISQCASERKSP